MRLVPVRYFLFLILLIFASQLRAQEGARALRISSGDTLEITNLFGKVILSTVGTRDDTQGTYTLQLIAPAGLDESDVKISQGKGKLTVKARPAKPKRIDLILQVPERVKLRVTTNEGAIEASGNIAEIEAVTETGTVAVDVPVSALSYRFLWTESKPRYLSDIDVASIKERSAGRFEIKGQHKEKDADEDAEDRVSLNITTARGIILLNVPPNEVASDLRERPLTEAAKAIVRSGDSILSDAIRRASPKHFGDFMTSLRAYERAPQFASGSRGIVVPHGRIKTATVRVTDAKNRSIQGLTATDFEIAENGRPAEVLNVSRSAAPFDLVLLLDVSGSVDNYVNFIRKAARSFVQTVGPEDRVAIVIFNEDVKLLSTFTTDKGKLSESLDTFDAGGGTAYYDALGYVISDTLRANRSGRTAVVVLTDGADNRSFLSFDPLLGSIQESGVLIYPVYVPSGLIALAAQNADIDPTRKRYMSLSARSEGEGERLAKISGGVYYPITQISELQQAYEDIVFQMRSAYDVTYRSPSETSGGVSPKLKIKVKDERAYTSVTSVVARHE
jgi:Ca-activated chloride channel homolog